MNHWLTVVGACLALVGTLVLGVELLKSKDDEAADTAFHSDQDKIDSVVRETLVLLRNMFSDHGQFIAGYLLALEEDLKPLFKPLLENGEDQESKAILAASLLLRHRAIEGFNQSQQNFASSTDPERALLLVQEAQKRITTRFTEQEAKARRLRALAQWGVVLVGTGAFAQLLDALIHS
jgi:hypothetical protein